MKTEVESFKYTITGKKNKEISYFSNVEGYSGCYSHIYRDKEGMHILFQLFKTRLNIFDKIKRFFKWKQQ